MKIFETYKSTEKSLLMKFRQASHDNNIEQMQQMAETLSRDAPVLSDKSAWQLQRWMKLKYSVV